MSSISRVLCSEEGGSGGKIRRQRRHGALASSPYQRSLPSFPQNQTSNWFLRASRVITNGAGKLISSVFGYNNLDRENNSGSEDDDDIFLEVDESAQIGITPDTDKNVTSGAELVRQKSEVKMTIEQLIQQVAFSRAECIHLTKILESRVVDYPVPKEAEDAAQRGIAHPEEARSPRLGRKSPDISPRWCSSLKSVDLGGSSIQAPRYDICNATVMEAKKWLAEKRLVSCSSLGGDQLRTLSTSAHLPVTEGADCSPVDMAKSYMQVRSAWASPSLSHTGFRTPPLAGAHFDGDRGPHTISGNTSPSSKVLKRNSFAVGTWNSDGIRRVRLKSTENILETPAFKQIDSSSRMSEPEVCQIPSTTDEKQAEPEKSLGGSVKLPAELATNDGNSDGIFIFPDEKFIEGNIPLTGGLDTEAQNKASNRVLSEPEQTMNTQNLRPEAASSIFPDSMSLQNNGDLLVGALNAEQNVTVPLEIKHGFTSDAVEVAVANNALTSSPETSSQVETTHLAKNAAKPKQLPGLKESNTGIDSGRQNGGNHLEQLTNGVTANGFASSPSSSAAGADVGPTSERSHNLFGSSNGTVAVGNTVESYELSSKAFIEIPIVDGADGVEDGLRKDSSIKDELPLSQQSNSSHEVADRRGQGVGKRGRKVLTSQRGRGRARGRGNVRGK